MTRFAFDREWTAALVLSAPTLPPLIFSPPDSRLRLAPPHHHLSWLWILHNLCNLRPSVTKVEQRKTEQAYKYGTSIHVCPHSPTHTHSPWQHLSSVMNRGKATPVPAINKHVMAGKLREVDQQASGEPSDFILVPKPFSNQLPCRMKTHDKHRCHLSIHRAVILIKPPAGRLRLQRLFGFANSTI